MQIKTYRGVPIHALNHYVPASSGKESYSELLRNFKFHGSASSTQHFTNELAKLLTTRGLNSQEVFIATVPSSTEGRSHNGFPKLINMLRGRFNIQNRGNLLVRTSSKMPAHQGGSRSKEINRSTLSVPIHIKESIQGKSVILIDDITTTGASLEVAIDILTQAGAAVRIAVALGKTKRN